MAPILVLLLFLLMLRPKILAEQVSVTISNGYDMYITIANGTVVDHVANGVKCEVGGLPCDFQCTDNNMTWFSDSSTLYLDVTVAGSLPSVVYTLEQYTNCTLRLCTAQNILLLMNDLDSRIPTQREMMELFHIKDSCSQLFSSNNQIRRAFVTVERHFILNMMAATRLEMQSSINYNMKDMDLNVVNIRDADLSSSEWIRIDAPQNEPFTPRIWFPVFSVSTIPKEERIIGLVSYRHHSHFQLDQEHISSTVLRIELLGGRRLDNLRTPIKMTFDVEKHSDMESGRLQCHYLDEHDWLWKTDGCETHNTSTTEIMCICNHTTAFAVLLIRTESVAEEHWKILSCISYIGCGLSAFFTALSITIYVFNRNHRMDYSISIHVSLSGALFLLNSTFLLTEWGPTLRLAWVCEFFAASMHYSLLCCFTWMAIEGLHLYLLLIKVFNSHYKYYLLKLSLAGWGIPGVVVAASLSVRDHKQLYGVTHVSMAETNQTTAICWITDDSFFYSVNLVYFALVFVFNSGILVSVAFSICKMQQVLRSNARLVAGAERKSWRNPLRFNTSCRSGLIVLGLTCLMGTAWGLAFLGSGYVNYPILYLFCILNSTQGFFMFLWVCQSANKQRNQEMEDRMTSTAVKTSAVKSE